MRLTTESYGEFARRWKSGEYRSQRLGQAFINFFDLRASEGDEVRFCRLWEATETDAYDLIESVLRDYQL